MKFFSRNSVVLFAISVASTLIMVSCAVESTGLSSYDDIYLDEAEIKEQDDAFEKQQEIERKQYAERLRAYRQKVEQEENQYNDEQEYSYNTDDTVFDMDDYYDYAYTARIKRFHSPRIIYNYYDDFYTDLCWYDADPLFWGTSIYLGYRWWYPTSWYWGWNYGWGWHRPFYWDRPWGWGYYAWDWYAPYRPWGHYHSPWYFNSWDRNSNFYRRPTQMTRNGGSRSNTSATGFRYNDNNRRQNTETSFGDKYNQRYGNATNRNNRAINSNTRRSNTTNTRVQNQKGNESNTRSYTPASQRQQRSSNEYRRNSNNSRSNVNTRSSNSNNRSSSVRSSSRSSSMSRSSSHSSGGSSRRR